MISVIVPVLNEASALPAALEDLLGRAGDFEVVVVDGGSTDGTRAIALRDSRIRVLDAPKGRPSQMNAGAALARGDVLLFLHADTRLPADAFALLDADEAAVGWQAGAFRHRFTPSDWRLRLLSALNNLRCRCTRISYGDQAMFVRRRLFEQLGGFPPVAMLGDVILSERLRRVTRPVLLDAVATTDARRFLHHGVWRSTARALAILTRHAVGADPVGDGFSDEVR